MVNEIDLGGSKMKEIALRGYGGIRSGVEDIRIGSCTICAEERLKSVT